MKKIIFGLVMVCAAPAAAMAWTTDNGGNSYPYWNYYYRNSQPQVTIAVSPLNSPFGLSCAGFGSNGSGVTWVLTNKTEALAAEQGFVTYPGEETPTYAPMTTSWSGTDLSTTTVGSDTIVVKYKSSGLKQGYATVTDGTITEVVDCGTVWVNTGRPVVKKVVSSSGLEIDY